MALVEDLIAQVTDPGLRDAIAREVTDLKKRLSWGLTFERHAPEIAWLRHAPITVGATVIDRRTALPWRVSAVDGDSLTIEAGETTRTVPVIEVFLETRFDEAVYPALTSLGEIRRGPTERPTHAVIEGENYYALELLSFTHAGRFDCVYLDPPYNTLDDDWKYNNRYIDRNDAMRHSKWLSMMERRLRLARRVLRPDGILVVAIDENEHAYLVMLLEQLFRGYDITSVAVVHNPRGIQGDNFSFTNDFAVFVVPRKGLVAARSLSEAMSDEDPYPSDGDEADAAPAEDDAEPAATAGPRGWPLRNWGTESLRTDARNCFYPIYVRDEAIVGFGEVAANDYHPAGVNEPGPDGTTAIWPIDPKGVERKWRYARQSVEAIRGQLLVRRIRDRLDIDLVKEAGAFRTVWRNPRYDANTHGTQVISRFISEPFPYPKSLYTMRDVLYAATGDRPQALILDYFAGSGTTLHATWLLNAEDGGTRQCFIVTNNEVEKAERARLAAAGHFEGDREFEQRGIFEAVTRPRLTAALKGERADGEPVEGRYLTGRDYSAGFEENIEFFELDFLDPIDVQLGLRAEALAPTLWLMAGGVGERTTIDPTAPYHLPPDGPYAIVFDPAGVAEVAEQLATRPDVRRVFIVAGSDDAYTAVAERLPEGIETTMLYRSYLDACRRVGESTR